MSAVEPVAVIGMACRFPGASDVDGYWRLLIEGREGISHFTPEQLLAAGMDPDVIREPGYVPVRGLIDGTATFDWPFFRYSRSEAATIDPQQRVFLECASTAIDDAGLDPARFAGEIGVFAGCDYTTTPPDPALDPLTLVIGRDKDFLATRVAYKLGLRGPAVTVQTACSTSLTAVHHAVSSLQTHECDVALAGGITLAAPWRRGYRYQEGSILSPDGTCRPFDADAAGTVPSDGVGVVVLKRLSGATDDRDRILAVILGTAINNDGNDKIGYTAPSVAGQRKVIHKAHRRAGVTAADIGYVEAHGTATRIGDPIEVQALADVFTNDGTAAAPCWLGSVKGNVGHTGAAAGVAGLIKTVLMLQHRQLVPTVHFRRANPLLPLAGTPLQVCTEVRDFAGAGIAHAGVSSFGVGGTNAHAVLATAPDPPHTPRKTAGHRSYVYALSTTAAETMPAARAGLAAFLRARPDLAPADVAWTLACRRALPIRHTVVADSLPEAVQRLQAQTTPPSTWESAPQVAFLFPGQGTLREAAAAAAYHRLPQFKAGFDEIAQAIREVSDADLSPLIGEAPDPAWFTETVHQQLGLLAIGYGLGRQLLYWGIEPAAMIGNSIGEYVAATVSGVWSPKDAAAIVHARATAMRRTDPGRMLAVNGRGGDLDAVLRSYPDITVAVQRPGGLILSGPVDSVEALAASHALDRWSTQPVDTVLAFHSPLMTPAANGVREAVAAATPHPPLYPMVSNLTGDWGERSHDPAYWAEHLLNPVRLDRGMGTLLSTGCNVFIELGPGGSMSGSLRRHADWSASHLSVPLLGGQAERAEAALLGALGALWSRGLDLPLAELSEHDSQRRCALPVRPFRADSPDGPVRPRGDKPSTQTTAPAVQQARAILAELWCDALGTTDVADHDDFFALGGESLILVQLLSRVQQRTGHSVAVPEFTATPTFGSLLALTGEGGEQQAPAGLVRYSDNGDATPLFLVADAFGTTLGYRSLAGILGAHRPVFGLEALGGDTRIETTAAAQLELLSSVEPQGSIVLAGWSFGAIVAHEMARRLRPGRVRNLLLLDGQIPDTRGRPMGTDPHFLKSVQGMQSAALTGRGQLGRLVMDKPDLCDAFVANLSAALCYRPEPVEAPVTVVRAAGRGPRGPHTEKSLATLYPRGVRVVETSGDHWTMLEPPHVTRLAELIETGKGREA